MTRPSQTCRRHAIALGLAAFVVLAGCQTLSEPSPSTQTHRPIHYVVIEDGASDGNVRTQAGDEVRWVNVRTTPVSVVFNGVQPGELACRRGFSASEGAHLMAVIHPDDNASLCFSAAGRRTYRVLDAHLPGVEPNHEAAVDVVVATEQSNNNASRHD
jgi:hypothetical protein